jgi:hypothetical protein
MKDAFIVSSHFQEDVRWLENYIFPVVLVSKDGGNYSTLNYDRYHNVHRAPNKLRESGAYLWFIINYWNNLPNKMFFIHGHEISHHQKLPIDKAIEKYSDCLFQDFNNYETYHFVLSEQQRSDPLWSNPAMHTLLGKDPRFIPKARSLSTTEVQTACARLGYRLVRAFERYVDGGYQERRTQAMKEEGVR